MKNLMINGVEVLRIENNNYYAEYTDEPGYECLMKVTRNEFIEELKKYSYVCLTTWNTYLRDKYLELVDYCKELEGKY